MNKLTTHQLRLLEQRIIEDGSVRVRWLARELGVSESIIYQARFLINCRPSGWQECLQGKQSIPASYRSCKKVSDYQIISFDM